MILPQPVPEEQKIAQLYAHTAMGRRLLPTAWVLENGRCSCTAGKDGDKPCLQGNKVGKHPLIGEWQKRATDEWDEVYSWHQWRPMANWGWLQDQTFALDVDPSRDGLVSLAQWEEQTGGPWPTLTQRTRSGGFHFIYTQPEDGMRVQGDILPGIEVRGIGSYIMIQPSVGWTLVDPDKTVSEADDDTLAMIAKHGLLLDGVETGRQHTGAAGDTTERLPSTDWFKENGFGGFSGSRNRDAYRLAWRLLALMDRHPDVWTVAMITQTMRECWLRTDQGAAPFDWDEVKGVLQSAWRRRERQKTQELEILTARARSLVGGGL